MNSRNIFVILGAFISVVGLISVVVATPYAVFNVLYEWGKLENPLGLSMYEALITWLMMFFIGWFGVITGAGIMDIDTNIYR